MNIDDLKAEAVRVSQEALAEPKYPAEVQTYSFKGHFYNAEFQLQKDQFFWSFSADVRVREVLRLLKAPFHSTDYFLMEDGTVVGSVPVDPNDWIRDDIIDR